MEKEKITKKNGMSRLKNLWESILITIQCQTCLRNHAFIEEVKAGGGPIHMVTTEAFQDPHLEDHWVGELPWYDYWTSSCLGFSKY